MKLDKRGLSQTTIDFLRESNAIEGVYDDDSLQQAIYAWEYLIGEKRLTSGVVLKTHKILMLHQNLMPDEKGYWRTCQVWIGGREGKPYREVPPLMTQWCNIANDTVRSYNDAWEPKDKIYKERIKQDHIEYETIHPFVDGNGRTGRMFLNWQRLQMGFDILVIKEKEKYAYYRWFESR